MNPELIKLLIGVGLQAFQSLQALKTADPVAFEAALIHIGAEHRAAMNRLSAAVSP